MTKNNKNKKTEEKVNKKKIDVKNKDNKNDKKASVKKIKKSSTKKKSYADDKKINVNSEMKQIIWTCVIVFLVLIVFYLISYFATGHTLFNSRDKGAVEFQYDEILVGTSFDMGENYYVVYYDMSDTENENYSSLVNSIETFKHGVNGVAVYTCDLSNSFNKPFVTTNEPNTNPFSAEDLLLNGPTVIKFSNGKVEEYIYGLNEVQVFLDSFSKTEE